MSGNLSILSEFGQSIHHTFNVIASLQDISTIFRVYTLVRNATGILQDLLQGSVTLAKDKLGVKVKPDGGKLVEEREIFNSLLEFISIAI